MSVRDFIQRQADHVRRAGPRVIFGKLRRHLPRWGFVALTFLPAFVFAVLMRLVVRWQLVRTGALIASRIGHYVGNTEQYLCERDVSAEPLPLDLFFHEGPVSNKQIGRMWDRVLKTSRFWGVVHLAGARLPNAERHRVGTTLIDRDGLRVASRQHLCFTDREVEGASASARPLVGEREWVCLHSRDAAYLSRMGPLGDWAHHDFRDSTVENFLPAASMLADRGHAVLRMGAAVGRPLPDGSDPLVVDYASSARTDLLDVYLEANCRFHLGDPSGLNEIPRAFKRPVAYTNVIPIGNDVFHSLAPGGIFIPKVVRRRDDGSALRFAEIVGWGVGEADWYYTSFYHDNGLVPEEDSAEEILDLAREMDDRIAGRWVETDEDRALQSRFWEIVGSHAHDVLGIRVGAAFLRAHERLLD